MKTLIALLFLCIFLSCNEDGKTNAPADIVGTWKLVEMYSDPGDGSGDFLPVESDKVITFSSKGIYISNGTTCTISRDTEEMSKGKFNWSEQVLIPENCEYGERELPYEIQESYLILHYFCIEGCAEKYEKIVE